MIKIIPTPIDVEEKEGSFSLLNISVNVNNGEDSRINMAVSDLCDEITNTTSIVTHFTVGESNNRRINIETIGNEGEGYTLDVSENEIAIEGQSSAGTFYGIQSLRQLICENGEEIPCCHIEDKPDFGIRGFYQDITRGRVNTLDKLKKIADMLSYYKINMLQLYIEDAFLFEEYEGIITEKEAMTAKEMLEFDDYCYNHFIELVPSLSSFGHLYTLLQSDQFNYICELENHKPCMHYWMEKQWHHTVNVYHPDAIKVIGSTIEQYIPLFRSNKFNICCDETNDLCNGVNAGKDKGEAYFYFLNLLIDILKKHGKTPMMWGDVAMAHADIVKEKVPSDTIFLSWNYHKETPEWIPKFYWELGYDQVLCPGTTSWNRFIEFIDVGEGNIRSFTSYGKKYGALGVLNTNWGDFGHVCSFNCNLYGMLYGAQKSWNVDADTDDSFEKAASYLLYGLRDYNLITELRKLGRAEESCEWGRMVRWQSDTKLGGQRNPFVYNDDGRTSDVAINDIATCKEVYELLNSLEIKPEIKNDLMLSARAIALMIREALYVNSVEGYTDKELLQKDFDEWFTDYKKAWLRDDKPSQLWRLEEYISTITDVPVQ